MSETAWWGLVTFIGSIGGAALVTLIAKSSWRRIGLWATGILGLGGAAILAVGLLYADSPWLASEQAPWGSLVQRILATLVVGLVALISVRTCLPNFLTLGILWGKGAPELPLPKDYVDNLLDSLLDKFGQEETLALVADAAYWRGQKRSNAKTPARVLCRQIREKPQHANLYLRRADEEEFSALVERVDQRPPAERARAFYQFHRVAAVFASAVDFYRTQEGQLRDTDWQHLGRLHADAMQALRTISLDRHVVYKGDLRVLGEMIRVRRHPSSGSYPFVLGDLRRRLEEDSAS